MVKGCAFTTKDWVCVKTAFSSDGQFFAVRWEDTCRVYTTSDQSLYAEYQLPARDICVPAVEAHESRATPVMNAKGCCAWLLIRFYMEQQKRGGNTKKIAGG